MGTHPPDRLLQRGPRPGLRRPHHELAQPVGPEWLHDTDLLPDDWAGLHGARVLYVPEEDRERLWARELEVAAGVLYEHFHSLRLRVCRRRKALGAAALSQDPVLVRMRGSLRFKLFLASLSLASFLILWRSCFRVAELSEGWTGRPHHG